jgi:alanine-glyoxylate transaminase/serine-glyoxylate transaminase/serine-pyruvate transaminase
MIAITDSCLADLKKLFRTAGHTYIYAANGHGGWEAALTNVLSRGETVLALESGRFALGWGEMAKMLGVEVEVLKGDWRRAVDPAAVEERLKRDKGHTIRRCWLCRSIPRRRSQRIPAIPRPSTRLSIRPC